MLVFFSSRRRHTRLQGDWSSDVCSSDLFSECHELFGDPNHGREAADLAVRTMRRARKTAITLAFDTQRSEERRVGKESRAQRSRRTARTEQDTVDVTKELRQLETSDI